MNLDLSITTDLAGQKMPIGPVFEAFGAAGFDAVHWCQDWAGEPVFYSTDYAQQIRQLADSHHLRVADIHGYSGTGYSGTGGGITYTDELFAAANINRAEFAAGLGADLVVLHLPISRSETPAEAAESSIALLRVIRPAFEKLGVRAAVENLAWPSHTDGFFETLLAEFPPEFLGFCYDSGHAILSKQTHLLGRYVDRLLVTHAHDNDGSADQHLLPGEGKANWPEIIRLLKQSSYRGTLNLEVKLPAEADLEAFCRKAYSRLTELWAGTA